MKIEKEQKRQLEVVRKRLLNSLRSCNEIPSTIALCALVELTVDAAVSLCGREAAVDAICQTVNKLMATKHRKAK